MAWIPSKAADQISILPEVRFIELDSEEGIPELDVSVPTIKTANFWNAGYDGGTFDVGIVDKGVDSDHPWWGSHPMTKKDSNDECSHGTRVTGIVASTNSQRKGVAFGMDTRLGMLLPIADEIDKIKA